MSDPSKCAPNLGSLLDSVNAQARLEQQRRIDRNTSLLLGLLRPPPMSKGTRAHEETKIQGNPLLAPSSPFLRVPAPASLPALPHPDPVERLLFLQNSISSLVSKGTERAAVQSNLKEHHARPQDLSLLTSSTPILEHLTPFKTGVSPTDSDPEEASSGSVAKPTKRKKSTSTNKFQVTILKPSEKKAGFCVPSSRDPKKGSVVGALAKYRRKWLRLEEKAATSKHLQGDKFVPEFFARSLFSEKSADHLYRKIHRLPTSSDFAQPQPPTKKARRCA